jgi:hypothetical protein
MTTREAGSRIGPYVVESPLGMARPHTGTVGGTQRCDS